MQSLIQPQGVVNTLNDDIPVLKLRVFSKILKSTIEDAFGVVKIEGEVSMPKLHTSGHLYFSLKDGDVTCDAVCWRPIAQKLTSLLQHGKQVICQGKVTTFEGRSKYQLVISQAWPLGEGKLSALFEALKKKLLDEGLFEAARKKALPPFPQHIGLITSPTGAVIQDMLTRLRTRYPCKVSLYPVNVQGTNALSDILGVLATLKNAHGKRKKVPDVVILARGGGSLEDLWTFNEESLVRHLANFPLPLISAIGHETDTTLSDFVADQRAPTPTAAIEIATPDGQYLRQLLTQMRKRLQRQMMQKWDQEKNKKTLIIQKLITQKNVFFTHEQRLDETGLRLKKGRDVIEVYRLRFAHIAHSLKHPKDLLKLNHVNFCELQRRFLQSFRTLLKEKKNRYHHIQTHLRLVSYHKTLERGFCLALSPKGKVIQAAEVAQKESLLTLTFQDGSLSVQPLKKGS